MLAVRDQEVRLAFISWREAGERFSHCDVTLLPVGSTEQHGPQNPLGTDHLIAYHLALEAGKRTGVTVLPPIPFGISSHHSSFPGTVWVRESVFKEYVKDVILSLKTHGVKKFIVVNGHGGNLHTLTSLARELRREGILVVTYEWWTLPQFKEIFSEDELGHAAAIETSLNLYLHSETVKMEAAVNEKPAKLPTDGLAYFPERTDDRVRSGVFGTSTTATREKGAKVFEIAVDALVKLVEEVRSLDFKA